ncbi:MAG: hypothetical protein Q4A27_01245 [bacterium]|nr:hypothetical protein [bacterium]
MNLTKKQAEVLEYIENFISKTGYSPTYREIQSALGYKSVATVAKHIDNLVILGKLEKSDRGEARSVGLKILPRSEFQDDEKFVFEFLKKKQNDFSKNGDLAAAKKIQSAIDEIWG